MIKERQNSSSIIGTIIAAPAKRTEIRPMVAAGGNRNEYGLKPEGVPIFGRISSGVIQRTSTTNPAPMDRRYSAALILGEISAEYSWRQCQRR